MAGYYRNMIGKTLRALRLNRGLSQAELAQALGTSNKTVSHWETDFTEPKNSQLKQIALFFRVSADVLLGIEDVTYPEIGDEADRP